MHEWSLFSLRTEAPSRAEKTNIALMRAKAGGFLRGDKRILNIVLIFSLFSLSGCGPTYPKEYVDKCVVDLCKKEYGVDVKVRVVGKTIGVYIPIRELIDKDLKLSPTALVKVDDVIMSVSRVALSTDANFNFYVIIAQDPLVPELELVIIRYVEDVKRFLVTDISRYEYFDRMIIEAKVTPQAQKEKLIRDLFSKLGLEISDNALDAYFKSGYVEAIPDIGYWNGNFFLKDIAMGEFLAKQIEERIRKDSNFNFVKGAYAEGTFDFMVEKKPEAEDPAGLKSIFAVLSKVIYGYKFRDYSVINLFYGGRNFLFEREKMDNIKERRIKLEDVI